MKKWECTVCGYIHEGNEPPDECPLCAADKSKFVEIQSTEEGSSPEKVATVEQGAVTETAPEPAPEPAPPAEPPPSGMATLLATVNALILRYHLHPITVHTPNGIVPMAFLFFFLSVLLGHPSFDAAALYSLVFVLIAMPAVLYTGYSTWQDRYRGAMTSVFKMKIGAAAVSVVLMLILVIWRAARPDVVAEPSGGRWLFLLLALVLLGAVGIAGHLGGQLVFGARKK
ncbi:rubredoxin-like domain-containing protein [Desulfobulbus alkaliphilus]|uniref:rubredoxin-like domain-containing protein n=1 Tax=Desulfobulbus alkaliphilus TaxID=869814 RepID=UPI0019647A71|nr:DUF2231 domain-containing protein [Desulfobulbus alkaliphilus]MBM9538088.1 rubredoxin-type Fe(Cys)4 protein [Desulfobulbus alkaliphilus]